MRAHGSESHNHEVPVSHRCGELMSGVQADDPDTVARSPFLRARVPASMRRAEIQKKRDFGRWEVTLLNRHAKVARTGEVAVDIGSKARISESLRCLPLAQFRSVFACFHARRFFSSTLTYRRDRARSQPLASLLQGRVSTSQRENAVSNSATAFADTQLAQRARRALVVDRSGHRRLT